MLIQNHYTLILQTEKGLRAIASLFILHRAILVTSVVRYARKEILVFIVSTISR